MYIKLKKKESHRVIRSCDFFLFFIIIDFYHILRYESKDHISR